MAQDLTRINFGDFLLKILANQNNDNNNKYATIFVLTLGKESSKLCGGVEKPVAPYRSLSSPSALHASSLIISVSHDCL